MSTVTDKIPVKIGVQTMMWGKSLTTERVTEMLEDIAAAAISVFPGIKEIGIEFAQKIHLLCYDISNKEVRDSCTEDELRNITEDSYDRKKDILRAERLAKILKKTKFEIHPKLKGEPLPKLTLLGFSGCGSLKKRIDFCKILKINHELTPKYFMVYQWCDGYKELVEEAATLTTKGVPLAFHPFCFGPDDKCYQIENKLKEIDHELKGLPNSVPQVQFVPDTAHLWLANEKIYRCNPNANPNAIKWVFETMLHRITAFHLKDWKKTFDSSLRYYSRGFTVLGGGSMSNHLDGVKVEDQRDSDLGMFCQNYAIHPGGDVQAGGDAQKERWVVIEQDFTIDDERGTLQQSLEWFRWIVDGTPAVPPLPEILPATLRLNENAPRRAGL